MLKFAFKFEIMQTNIQTITQFENFIWIDIVMPDKDKLFEIAKKYRLDIFQIKDSMERGHLPKFECQPDYNFLILRAFTSTMEEGATTISELSNKIAFFYNDDKLITIHIIPFAFLENVKKDFTSSDALLLFIAHKMIETYQPPLDELETQIANIEETLFIKDYRKISLEDLYYLKTQTRITKKLLQLFQNVIHQISVNEHNKSALQDSKDRLLSLIHSYEEVFEIANSLLNTYHSLNAQKSNDVMKLLTIFSAFFLPLTFIVGIYGMNFENMPELHWRFGYLIAWVLMTATIVFIYIWFKRKKII